MSIAQFLSSLLVDEAWAWPADWAWGVPMIVVTVLIHALGLGLVRHAALRVWRHSVGQGHETGVFVVVISLATLLATCLHGIEAAMWAGAYRFVGALSDNRSAMLYSLNAMTSYGHVDLHLNARWHLLGAIEALNGWLLFGLSTAFLFAVIEKVFFSLKDRQEHEDT